MVVSFQKKASDAHKAAIQLQSKADFHPQIKLDNNFGAFVEEEMVEEVAESEIEEDELPSVVEAHRVFAWNLALLPDLSEQARQPGPLLF